MSVFIPMISGILGDSDNLLSHGMINRSFGITGYEKDGYWVDEEIYIGQDKQEVIFGCAGGSEKQWGPLYRNSYDNGYEVRSYYLQIKKDEKVLLDSNQGCRTWYTYDSSTDTYTWDVVNFYKWFDGSYFRIIAEKTGAKSSYKKLPRTSYHLMNYVVWVAI